MIEDEVDVEVVAVEREALLTGDEGETFAEFEEEGLELIEEGLLDIGFDEAVRLRQSNKFHDDGIFEDVGGGENFLTFGREAADAGLVAALGETLEEETGDLTLELAGGPALLAGFDFVEGTGGGGLGAEQSAHGASTRDWRGADRGTKIGHAPDGSAERRGQGKKGHAVRGFLKRETKGHAVRGLFRR